MSRGRILAAISSTTFSRRRSKTRRGFRRGAARRPNMAGPGLIASETVAIVLAVNCALHAPAEGQATRLDFIEIFVGHFADRMLADGLNMSGIRDLLATEIAGQDRAAMKTEGTLSRTMAIIMPGSDLSQPAMPTSASYAWPRMVSSTESAMHSREGSEERMPSWPMAMPSVTVMVQNSRGVPPPAATPFLTAWAWRISEMLQGAASFQQEATPTKGWWICWWSAPLRRGRSDAAQRSGPSVTWRLGNLFLMSVLASIRGTCFPSLSPLIGPGRYSRRFRRLRQISKERYGFKEGVWRNSGASKRWPVPLPNVRRGLLRPRNNRGAAGNRYFLKRPGHVHAGVIRPPFRAGASADGFEGAKAVEGVTFL